MRKQCTKCGLLLPLTRFNKHPRGPQGLSSRCIGLLFTVAMICCGFNDYLDSKVERAVKEHTTTKPEEPGKGVGE